MPIAANPATRALLERARAVAARGAGGANLGAAITAVEAALRAGDEAGVAAAADALLDLLYKLDAD